MTFNISISSAAGFCSAFVAAVGCGSPSETHPGWGTPLLLHTGFQQTQNPTPQQRVLSPLLENIYPQKPNFPLQYHFGGSTSPGCSPPGGSSLSPAPAPAQLYPAQLGAGTGSAAKGQGSHPATAAPGKGLAKPFHQLPAHNPSFVCFCQVMGSCFGRETCLRRSRD